ncbi:DUF397 domain-containing protein [Streptomyces sp. NBC_00658]|uniref:DUF397 domain-containing protein n=1 Tax=Streptomyces sp. NBC_00658 TaxID=2975800 RepID=UPI00325298D8
MSKPSMGVAVPHDVDLSEACWRKSSYSGGANDCVEVAYLMGAESVGVAIRDSKCAWGPVLLVAPSSFAAFLGDPQLR